MEFKRDKCPWLKLKETSQGTLYWCENCGSIYNENGDWDENGPTMPMKIDRDTLYCPDQGYTV